MSRALALAWLVAAIAAALAGGRPAAAADGVDLEGTWYVLIHYKDDHARHPERERWEDRVWTFSRSDGRLHWTEYSIVVFDDESGRFERRDSGQYARVLHYWEPSARQQADIRDGLQVNDRGSKRKTLRGSDEDGWSSSAKGRPASSSSITYTEHWSITGLPDEPVFRRQDVLGSGRSDSLEGVTRYSTSVVQSEGERLRGKYVRDGVRHGWFRMQRTADSRPLDDSGSQMDRLIEHLSGDEVPTDWPVRPAEPGEIAEPDPLR